jgi:tetratricopeptide (TPR) repeat protein
VSIVQGANEEVAKPAQRLLDAAIAADAKYVPAYVERAYLQANKGTREQIDLARKDVERAVAIAPNNVAALIMRCRVLQVALTKIESPSNPEVDDAMKACQAAVEVAPDSADVHIVFARLHNFHCHDEEAMNSLEKARTEDRAQTGRALAHYVHLAFDGEYWDRAERASAELLRFEDEQRKARKSVLTRLGIPPEREAPLLRAVALMHDEKWTEAQAELEKQLEWLAHDSPDPILEAVTMRGLLYRIPNPSAQTKNKYAPLLKEHEKTIRDEIARDPLTAVDVVGYYQWIDPAKAVEWIELAKASTSSTEAFSCNASLRIASIYRAAGKLDEARAAAAQCKPRADRDWEKSCLEWVEKRLSQ